MLWDSLFLMLSLACRRTNLKSTLPFVNGFLHPAGNVQPPRFFRALHTSPGTR